MEGGLPPGSVRYVLDEMHCTSVAMRQKNKSGLNEVCTGCGFCDPSLIGLVD